MKANPNIDELLSSLVDGELPLRQQTEVQRLAARDPEVGRRLRQLQNCKILVNALPRAEAPDGLLEQIKRSVERKTLLEEQPVSGASSAGIINLMARRLMAAAAMIALLGVLGVVVYQIVAPVPGPSVRRPVARVDRSVRVESVRQPVAAPVVVADSGLSGRLEIRTATVAQADAILKRAIEQNGLSALVASDDALGTRTYQLVSSRQGVGRLLASLQSSWQSFDGATLHIEGPGGDVTGVTVDHVTPEQAASIVARENTAASVDAARSYAVINAMAQRTPGREVLEMLSNDSAVAQDLANIDDKVLIAGPEAGTTVAPPQGQVNTSLTIILLHTR
jgi:anti-sigma factor RsiW